MATGKDDREDVRVRPAARRKLDPWARMRVDGKDIGLWDEAAIPEGKHNISYTSHDGTKEKSVKLEIKGGARAKLSW